MKFIKRIGLGLILGCPTASAEVMLGAYVPGDGFSKQEIRNFNAVVPKPLSFINMFTSFSHDWNHLYWQTSNVVDEGAMPLISWMPIDLNKPNDNILPEIVLGQRDDYIDQWGAKLLAWVNQYPSDDQPKILLRFGHEFNGNWYAYGNSPTFYKAAWQHIHDRFESAGINQHVEWVWSGNNISVDDHDNITVYYPGADYVDWTSIDGYNFGSNYAWTNWESFEDTYSDSYLTLVNNYPEKPILIGEIGSAEETDLPSARWGQFGDNADAYENKSDWVADMLVQLETTFPAVRAVTWFNINKELGWSMSHGASTGLSSYIAGTSSNYYTTDFLSANGNDASETDTQPGIELAQPTELELAANEAAENYESVLATFKAVELRLNEAKNLVQVAQAEKNNLGKSRTEALSLMRESGSRYSSTRNEFLAKQKLFLDTRDDSAKSGAEMNKLRSIYMNEGGKLSSARARFLAKQDLYLTKRKNYLESHREFTNSKAGLVDAVATFEATKDINLPGSSDYDLLKSDVEKARKRYLASLDTFLVLRSELLVILNNFRDVRSELISITEQRKKSKSEFQASLGKYKQSRDEFFAALNDRKGSFSKLVEDRKSYLMLKSSYVEIHDKFVISADLLASRMKSFDGAQLEYQQSNQTRLDAYQMMAEANHLVSLEGSATRDGLIFEDGNNGNKDSKSKSSSSSSSSSSQSKTVVENSGNEKSTSKRKVIVKSISKNSQKALAQSIKPKPMDSDKAAQRKQKYKNMSHEEKINYKNVKMSVLEY